MDLVMKRGRVKVAGLEWWQWLTGSAAFTRAGARVSDRSDRLSFVGWCSDTFRVSDAKLAGKTIGEHSGTLKHPPHQWSELDTLTLFPVNFSLCLFLCPFLSKTYCDNKALLQLFPTSSLFFFFHSCSACKLLILPCHCWKQDTSLVSKQNLLFQA